MIYFFFASNAFQILRHEEFEEGCKATCNGYVSSLDLSRAAFGVSKLLHRGTSFIHTVHTMGSGAKQWLALVQKMIILLPS